MYRRFFRYTSIAFSLIIFGLLFGILSHAYEIFPYLGIPYLVPGIVVCAGLALLLFAFYLASKRFFEYAEGTIDIVQSHLELIKGSNSIVTSGIENVYISESKFLTQYSRLVERAKREVCIARVSLAPFYWFPEFIESTIQAVKRGVKFRILLLDPSSDSAKFMVTKGIRPYEGLRAELERSVVEWKRILERYQAIREMQNKEEAIEIRVIDAFLANFLMIVDDRVIVSTYGFSSSHKGIPYIEFGPQARQVSDFFVSQFDELWGHSSIFLPY